MRNFSKITMICDDNTYKVAGEHIESICKIFKTIKLNPENLHANEFAVGLALVCDEYKKIAKTVTAENVLDKYDGLSKTYIEGRFSHLADEIIKENEKDALHLADLDTLKEKLSAIFEVVDELPTGDEIRDILKYLGAPFSLSQVGAENGELGTVLEYSPLVRNRLTLIRLKRLFR